MQSATAILTGNLPAEPNSFIGRERDLAELARLLGEVRALTLSGLGGIGKTRLAVRLARDVLSGENTDEGPGDLDEAWLVELADWHDPVAQAVATILGVREEQGVPLAQTLAEALRSRHMLLILDTCEHQVSDCATLVQLLLARCPWLQIIATSREPLRVRGETVWRVPPLDLPPDGASGAELAAHEAVRLFAARAAGARPGFALTSENTASVARLCRTLDGIPLGIELSAARVRALSVEQIADRLRDRFQLLNSGDRTAPLRQQTLRATVDWSFELLDSDEQMLLRRLATFSGWNLDMAEQVCSDEAIGPDAVLGLLISLIDKSLVVLDGEAAGDARYRLLDTIREYAGERLAAAGEKTRWRCATGTASWRWWRRPSAGCSTAASRRGRCAGRCSAGASPSTATSASRCRPAWRTGTRTRACGCASGCATCGCRTATPARRPPGWTGSSSCPTRRCPRRCAGGPWRSAPR